MINPLRDHTLMMLIKQFLVVFIVSVMLIGAAIFLDIRYPQAGRPESVIVLIKALDGIGVTLLISVIFSYIAGTSSFIGKIRSILESIVISKTFLSSISEDLKSEVVYLLTKPDNLKENKHKYSTEYFESLVKNAEMFHAKPAKSNHTMHVHVYTDENGLEVTARSEYKFILHPSQHGYPPLAVPHSSLSISRIKFWQIEILPVPSELESHLNNESQIEIYSSDNFRSDVFEIDLSKYNTQTKPLLVTIQTIEVGSSGHYIYRFDFDCPTFWFDFQMRLDDFLSITDSVVYCCSGEISKHTSCPKNHLSLRGQGYIDEKSGIIIHITGDRQKSLLC